MPCKAFESARSGSDLGTIVRRSSSRRSRCSKRWSRYVRSLRVLLFQPLTLPLGFGGQHGYIGKSTATVALREVLDAINARRVSDQSHLDDSLLTCDIIEAMLDLGVVEDEEYVAGQFALGHEGYSCIVLTSFDFRASPMGVAIGTAFRAIVSGRTKGHGEQVSGWAFSV